MLLEEGIGTHESEELKENDCVGIQRFINNSWSLDFAPHGRHYPGNKWGPTEVVPQAGVIPSC